MLDNPETQGTSACCLSKLFGVKCDGNGAAADFVG